MSILFSIAPRGGDQRIGFQQIGLCKVFVEVDGGIFYAFGRRKICPTVPCSEFHIGSILDRKGIIRFDVATDIVGIAVPNKFTSGIVIQRSAFAAENDIFAFDCGLRRVPIVKIDGIFGGKPGDCIKHRHCDLSP